MTVGPPEYRGAFLAQQVDGRALLFGLSDQPLKQALKVGLFGHRCQILWELSALRRGSTSNQGSSSGLPPPAVPRRGPR